MTICLATICDNGNYVVLVSDAMITGEHLSIKFEHKRPKITKLAANCAVATAGDALADAELFDAVKQRIDQLKTPRIQEIVECIKMCYIELRQKEIRERILIPRGINDIETFYQMQQDLIREVALTIQSEIESYEYGLEILVGGVDKKGAHVYMIDDPGTSVVFDSIGYHAIGSGYPHAVTTFITNDFHQGISLPDALLISYEAKKIAERAPGVGTNITSVAIVSKQNVHFFNKEEVTQLDAIYASKLSAEKEFAESRNWGKELEELISQIEL